MSKEKDTRAPLPQSSNTPQTLSSDYTVAHTGHTGALRGDVTQTLSLDYAQMHTATTAQTRSLPIPPKPASSPAQGSITQTLSSDYTLAHLEKNEVLEKEEEMPEEDGLEEGEGEEETGSFDPFLGATRLPNGAITLGHELGQGAFGQVYQGKWGERPVALKKIDLAHAKKNFPHMDEAQILESLQWEVSRLSTVSHPNLVQFYGIYQEESQAYIVMEFCEGGTLQNALTQKNIRWSMRWQWALEITRGLVYLHDQGVLHRDLKAENVLLDRYGRAKLADLGVAQVDALLQEKEAKVVESGLQDKKFIAPENIDHPNLSTKATDIYALGLVFWQLATGKIPRRLNTLSDPEKNSWLTGQSLREPIPEDCPDAFKALIIRCWQYDPKKRGDVESLLEHLKTFIQTLHQKETPWLPAADALDELLHEKRIEGLSYIAPYLTRQRVDEPIETYWQRWETKIADTTLSLNTTTSTLSTLTTTTTTSSATTTLTANIITSVSAMVGNPPLELHQTLQNFITRPGNRTLLLLGDSGLGKTLSVCLFADQLLGEWHLHRQRPDTHIAPVYLPLLLRPVLKSWSHSALQQAFTKVIDYYDLKNSTIPLLLIIDGYDECQLDIAPQNLAIQLGISPQASVKLIVTCRPQTVEENQLANCFAFQGQLETRYFLPFNVKQVLVYLKDRLSWTEEIHQQYENKLKNTPALCTILRNPFVLSLLVQSWEAIAKQDFKQLNRWVIYEGFVTHWLTTRQTLLPSAVRRVLKGQSANLVESFGVFASELAFTAFQQKGIALSYEQIQQFIESPWLTVETLLKQSAHRQFLQRQAQLTENQKRRALLTEEDYIQIMLGRGQQFALGAPLKARALGYEFTHKSFFEYFVAKRLLQLSNEATMAQIIQTGQSLLNVRDVQEEEEILTFWQEGWSHKRHQVLSEPFFNMIKASREDTSVATSSANAATLLNSAEISFSTQDLHGVKIPGANLTGALLDHTNFRDADLSNVKLQGAFLRETDFRNSKMLGTNFGEFSHLFKKGINYIVLSPDGSLMAVALNDKVIELRNGVNYNEKCGELRGHTDGVTSAAFSPDGKFLVSGSSDKTVRLWEISSSQEKHIWQGHTDIENNIDFSPSIRSVAFSPDGKLIAFGRGETLRLLEVFSGNEKHTLQGPEWVMSIAFSPDGKLLASGEIWGTVRLWEVSSGKEKSAFRGHVKWVNATLSPDGYPIKSGSFIDRARRVREQHSKEEKIKLQGHTEPVNSVAFSPDGEFLASGSSDQTIRIWDWKSQKQQVVLQGHTNAVNSIAFSPDGEFLVSGSDDQTVCVWDWKSQKQRVVLGDTSSVTSVVFSSDGKYLFSKSFDGVVAWEWKSQKQGAMLRGHTGIVTSVAFSPCGKFLASGSSDQTARMWEWKSQKQKAELRGHTGTVTSVAFSPCGKFLASGSSDQTVRVWEWKSQKQKAELQGLQGQGHINNITSIAFSPNGEFLASGSTGFSSHHVYIWEWRLQKEKIELQKHKKEVKSVAFSLNGEFLALGSSKSIYVWEWKSQEQKAVLRGGSIDVESVAFSSDGKYLVSGDFHGKIYVWGGNLEKGKKEVELLGHSSSVNSVTFSPDGEFLASGSSDQTIRVWEWKLQKQSAVLQGHLGAVNSVAFSPDGKLLASGSNDKAIFLWRCVTLANQEMWILHYRFISVFALSAFNSHLKDVEISPSNKQLLIQNGAEEKLGPTIEEIPIVIKPIDQKQPTTTSMLTSTMTTSPNHPPAFHSSPISQSSPWARASAQHSENQFVIQTTNKRKALSNAIKKAPDQDNSKKEEDEAKQKKCFVM